MEGPGTSFRVTARFEKRYLECWMDFLRGKWALTIVTRKPPFYEDAFHVLDSPQHLEWDLAGVGSEEEKSQIVTFCDLTERCCVTDPNKRLTAEQCEMEVNVMSSTIPSDQPWSSAKTRKAQATFAKAERLYRTLFNLPGFAKASYWLGYVYYRQLKGGEAVKAFEQARDAYMKIEDMRGIADASFLLGLVYQVQNNFQLARESFLLAKTKCIDIRDQRGLANASFQLGQVEFSCHQYVEAQPLLLEAENIYGLLGDEEGRKRASLALCNSQIQLLANTRNPSSSGARDSNGRSLVGQDAQAAQVEHPTAQVDHETPADVPVTTAEGNSFELCPPPVRDMGDFVGWISMSPSFSNGGFCDVFYGMHKNGEPVALKRVRNPNNSDLIRVWMRL
ncbi:hypothetical protein M407DRAFT_7536 [Tulasnella calospora MUT 4182]|uniref:Uncharacterized protein n=1 Tax=Tulasnella calospora MUT 4182 TaxID=1051891 RepID=A0A0C3KZW7_9AGAM|nr:hypothetical protein M407DRAFT_7536 [Tulasnella calospora MUT 4182]